MLRFFLPSKCIVSEDSSSDEEVEAPAIASDSDEEVVFTKPNVAGSTSAAPKNEDVQMAKVVAISEKKGNLGVQHLQVLEVYIAQL